MIALLLLIVVWLSPSPAHALSPTAGTPIQLYGGEALSLTGAATLRGLLLAMPTALYPHLEAITVDNTPAPPTGTICEGLFAGPCRINIWSSGEAVLFEDPFPSDAPIHAVATGLYPVIAHELGHWVSLSARIHRRDWEKALVAEAGCEPSHYLRSMFGQCFFSGFPQEFGASMVNQWATCSECTLRLGLAQWDAGIPHPLDQVVYLLWLFGSRPAGDTEHLAGSVLTYRANGNLPVVTPWTVRPWRCGGDVTVTGPAFALTLTLDESCRVTAVGAREGL